MTNELPFENGETPLAEKFNKLQPRAHDGGTVEEVLDALKPMTSVAQLQDYEGSATTVRLIVSEIVRHYRRDDSDSTSPADTANLVVVDLLGRRWKRVYGDATGDVQALRDSAYIAKAAAEVAKDEAYGAAELQFSFRTRALMEAAADPIPEGKLASVTQDGANTGVWAKRDGVMEFESNRTFSGVAAESFEPSWAGKNDGWLDRGFRRLNLEDGTCLGQVRMWKNTPDIVLTDVWAKARSTHPKFDGFSLVCTNDGGDDAENLCGPAILLSDIEAVENDPLTVYVLIEATGGNAFAPGAFTSGIVGNLVGVQKDPKSSTGQIFIPAGAGFNFLRHDLVVPAGATHFSLYPYVSAGSSETVAIWAFRGEAKYGPSWPSLGDTAALKIEAAQASADAAAATEQLLSLSRVVDKVTTGDRTDAISMVLGSAIAQPEVEGYTGFCQTFTTPSAITSNALYIGGIPRGTTTKKWKKIKGVMRTHATDPAQPGATVVAVAELLVDPDTVPLGEMSIPWRDPDTNALKTVVRADLLAVYGIAFQAWVDDDVKATAGEQRAISITGAAKLTSYYVTTENARSGLWLPYAGNPSYAMAAVAFSAISQAPQTVLSDTAKTDALASANLLQPAPLPYADLGRMRQFRSIAARRMQPYPEQGLRIVYGAIGDSWSWDETYYLQRLARSLIAKLGDGGIGWLGFGINAGRMGLDARGEYYLASPLTNWTSNYHSGSTSPNISDARTSTSGATIKVASISGAFHPALSAAKLHFTGTADGVIRWRWDNGAWSVATNVQGVGAQQTLDLTGFPTTPVQRIDPTTGKPIVALIDHRVLEIEVVAGSVVLCGVDFQSSTDGIVFHKLGSSGSKASDWAMSLGLAFRNALAALGLTSLQILLMTNDQAAGVPPKVAALQIGAICADAKAAIPGLDVMIVVPPENPAGYPTWMEDYAEELRKQAAISKTAYLNLQHAFGDARNPAEYALGSIIALFKDPAHVNSAGGGLVEFELERSLLWR